MRSSSMRSGQMDPLTSGIFNKQNSLNSAWIQKPLSIPPPPPPENTAPEKKKKKHKLTEKGLLKQLRLMTQRSYEKYHQHLEDRVNRRQMRDIRRLHNEEDVSDDSEDEELDSFEGLTEDEKWNRMMNKNREILREKEVRREMVRELKRQNNLQNKFRKQGHNANTPADKLQEEVEKRISEMEIFKKDVVIMEPLPFVIVALEMSLIGYQETIRFLLRNDVQSQFEKASMEQVQISLELAFQNRTSPIQVKIEMLWRFAVIMHDFCHWSRGTLRHKYLLLASQAYMILYDQVFIERKRRDEVREGDDEELKALLSPEADWEVGHPDLYWELGAIVNSTEMQIDAEDTVTLYNAMEKINNTSAYSVLRDKVLPVPIPEDIPRPDK